MRWSTRILSLAVLSVGAMALSEFPVSAAQQAEAKAVAAGNTAFAFDLYGQLVKTRKGNLFYSPASIHAALAMTYAGARAQTAEQMVKTMHYPANRDELAKAYGALLKDLNTPQLDWDKKPAYELVISNALWGQKGFTFEKEFLVLNREHYGAGLNPVDFAQSEAARKTINDWVEKQTKERIKDLIPPNVLTAATRLVLTNAIYFKSPWAHSFKAAQTKQGPFTLLDGGIAQVPLMNQERRFGYYEDADVQVLELPYKRGELGMVVVLPRKNGGLPTVEKTLSAQALAKWLALKNTKVKVTLPKFKIESGFSVVDQLKALGMTAAFDAAAADFTGIAKPPAGLYISDVIHKAFVEVDEKGTEAAAATAVVVALGAAPPPPSEPKVFKADHPFLFLIRHHRTGEVLFVGRVMDPKGK